MDNHTRRRSSLADDERSVSEVLGYIIVFSIVITSVLVVVLGGLSAVEDGRDAERAMNAERAFDVLADNFGAIYERDAPSRATEMDLGQAELFYGDTVNVSIYNASSGNLIVARDLRPIQMRVTEERGLIYEAGAVFRRSEGGAVTMVRDPPFRFGDNVHVPVVQTRAPAFESAGGTTALLRAIGTHREVAAAGTSGNLEIEIESPRYEIWERALDQRNNVDCGTENSDTAVCDVTGVDTAAITAHEIEISLIL